jgi:hypothetical protein
VPHLSPTPVREKIYDLKDLPKITGAGGKRDGFVLGASAADWTYLNRNAEV